MLIDMKMKYKSVAKLDQYGRLKIYVDPTHLSPFLRMAKLAEILYGV